MRIGFSQRTALALFFTLSAVRGQNPPAAGAQISITSDNGAPVTITAADIAGMTHQSATVLDGDHVATYSGVLLSDVLVKAGVAFSKPAQPAQSQELTGIVLADGKAGKTVVFALAEIDPSIGGAHAIIADLFLGKPLSSDDGPLRLIVETDRGSTRFVSGLSRIEVRHVTANTSVK